MPKESQINEYSDYNDFVGYMETLFPNTYHEGGGGL